MTTAVRHTRTIEHKQVPVELKNVDVGARTFSGLSAAFALDLGGDIIQRGAFSRTLSDFAASKRKLIYLIDSHSYFSIRSVLGKMVAAEETDAGLLSTFQVVEGMDGDEALRRLEGGFVDSMSIGYQAIQSRDPNDAEKLQGAQRVMTEVKLIEVSLVIFPMNPEAVVGGKAADLSLPDEITDPAEIAAWAAKRDQITALLRSATPAGGLAPEDAARLATDEMVRDLTLRRLGIA